MGFDALTDTELANERAAVTSAALDTARRAAARHLLAGLPGDLGQPEAIVKILMTNDIDDDRHELLEAFQKPWSLLALRIVAGTLANPAAAVRDARDRGATVPEIAAALGITTQGVYATYADQVVRRPRPRKTASLLLTRRRADRAD